MDSWATAVILGVVEGLTEFIPVSSTGHLVVAGHLMGFVGDKATSFEVAIQFGAILAVVALYWRRFIGLIPYGLASGSGSKLVGKSGVGRIALATFPALVVGYLVRHEIKEHLFNPTAVAWALAAGGVGILISERMISGRRTSSLESLTLTQALGVGLFQILALWPGTSRAAATIIGGMLLGLDRKGAAEFSFLIAVPVMLAATSYELLTLRDLLTAQDLVQFGVGFLVSFVVALIAVKTFVSYLARWSLAPFGWYRIIVAPIFYFLTQDSSR